MIDQSDRLFINRVRGLSILRVVLAHLGLSWFFTPYSQLVAVFLPLLFFVSGAVSFSSFSRARSYGEFIKKRLLSLVVPVYLVVFVSFILLSVLTGDWLLRKDVALQWLQLIPQSSAMPFPLGQVWFIHTLVIIVIISLPIFRVALVNKFILIVIIIITLLISFLQLIYPIGSFLIIYDHNIYKPLVHLGFYLFGALWVSSQSHFNRSYNISYALASLILVVVLYQTLNLTFLMSDHVFFPDAYYVLLSYSAIFFVLCLKGFITKLFDNSKLANKFILYFSHHAYSIFILHTLFIYLSESVFGLTGVMESPLLAFIKISFVIMASCVFSIPVTYVTKKAIGGFKSLTVTRLSVVLRGLVNK